MRQPTFVALAQGVAPESVVHDGDGGGDEAAGAAVVIGTGSPLRAQVIAGGQHLTLSNPEKVLYPARRDDQARRRLLLRADRAGAARAPRRPAADRDALPGRGRRQGVLREAVAQPPPGVGADVRGAQRAPRDDRLHARAGPADARVAREPRRARAARAAAPRARAGAPGRGRLRPRPGRAGDDHRVLPGRAVARGRVRAARPGELPEDVGVQGPAGVRPARRRGRPTSRRRRSRARSRSSSSGPSRRSRCRA